jgi:hypothetical protein
VSIKFLKPTVRSNYVNIFETFVRGHHPGEYEAVGSMKKKFGRCLVFKGFLGGGMFLFFARNYGVCNGTRPPSTYIYSWWFHVGTFVNYELQC